MARKARKYGETGIYHIVMRGNNRQSIFYDDSDRLLFLNRLKKYTRELNIDLYSYCLMGNHVHLLIGNGNKNMPILIQKLSCSYVYYFNHKYERCGHLFQSRYKSEAVESIEYFKTVYRYILQNPEKANICRFYNYRWNSYGCINREDSFLNNTFVFQIFNSKQELMNFINIQNNDRCMDYSETENSSDELISAFINQFLKINSPLEIANFPEERKKVSLNLLKKCKISINQLSRLTSISKKLIKTY